jgi:predicted HTH transcriptional regulator
MAVNEEKFMTAEELLKTISLGETTMVQFKVAFDNQDKIAAEMIAFANGKGGMIIFGVKDKTGDIIGLDYEGLQTINNKIATIASDLIKPPVFLFTESMLIEKGADKKKILIAHIEEGIHKPYKDRNGTIWTKQGSDKRKLTDNDEIARLFQQSGMMYADEMIVPDTSEADIDKDKVEEYIGQLSLSDRPAILDKQLYQNLRIMKKDKLTLGGLLFFGKDPQQSRPAFGIAAISFFGNSIGGTEYRDSRNITGTIPKLFKEGMSFFNANLLHKQNGQNFNSEGILEISVIALEELLQNALVHRDYSRNSPIRLTILDNRVEIISPGKLPNGLTVESIKLGQAVVRNNLLRTYCSRFMIYRGFGSGITRALENQPNIELINDVDGEQFIVKIPREEK